MELLSLSNNKWEKVQINLFVVLLFVFVNPIYALFVCAFLNLTNTKINYWIFSFMFVLSFSLLFYLKDYSYIGITKGWDINWHIISFQNIDDLSWSGIIYRFISIPSGNEPLFWIYVKLVRTLLTSNASYYVFIQYITIFILIAYLGKIVNTKKFVIIILCVLLLNFSVLSNVWEVWRNTMAFLILLIGVFSFDTREKNWFSRVFIYSAMFFHIIAVPLVIFFEIFAFINQRSHKYKISKLYSKEMIVYVILIIFAFTIITQYGLLIGEYLGLSRQLFYFLNIMPQGIGYDALFNSFSVLVCLFLWINRKKLTRPDIFIATQYFLITILFIEMSMPDIFSRITYFVMFGTTILIGKMMAANFKAGFILISILFIYNVSIINYSEEVIRMLTPRLHYEYTNPAYGLGAMILNSDTILNFNY